MFRRNQNFAPITPADTPQAQQVIETLETAYDNIELDPHQVILVGSAALAIMGVTLDPDPLKPNKPRLGDVDMVSTTAEIRRQVKELGNFSPVAHNNIVSSNHQTVIRSELSYPLPIELISRFDRGFISDTKEHDRKLLKFWRKRSSPIEGTDFRIADSHILKSNLQKDREPKGNNDYTNLLNTLRDSKKR